MAVTDKVRGQVIKSVRLLGTSSNPKELINTVSQACGAANQLSSQCLARPTLPSEQERLGAVKGDGVRRGHDMERGLM